MQEGTNEKSHAEQWVIYSSPQTLTLLSSPNLLGAVWELTYQRLLHVNPTLKQDGFKLINSFKINRIIKKQFISKLVRTIKTTNLRDIHRPPLPKYPAPTLSSQLPNPCFNFHMKSSFRYDPRPPYTRCSARIPSLRAWLSTNYNNTKVETYIQKFKQLYKLQSTMKHYISINVGGLKTSYQNSLGANLWLSDI